MIIPSSVTDSIAAAGIDVSNDWLSATAPVWNADYSAVLTQPISIAVTPLADMRFLGVTAATITIRISSAPLSLVSWSGIATLVADDTTGGGSPIYPVHNSFTGRDVADAHPLASITGLVDALDGKAAALHASTHYAGGADPIAGQSLAGLQATDSPAFNQLVLTKSGGGVSGANICALVLDSNEPGFAFKKDAGPSQNKYWNIGVNAGDWGPSFYHINDAKTLKTPVWQTRFNTTTGRIEFTLGLSGYTDTIVNGALKIGSLAGTLIGTAGVVSALSGTDLVLGNGTTIPQSTFVTAGSYLALAGGTMTNDAQVAFNNTAAAWEQSAITITRPFIAGSQTQDAGIDISTANGHGLRIALQSGNYYSGLQVNNASSEFAVELLLSGAGTKSLYAAGLVLLDGAVDAGAGVNVSGGAIQIAGNDAITSARAGDLTALKVGSLAGVLKGVAGDVAVASAGVDYTKPLGSVGTFSSISGTSLTAVYSLSIPGGTISNGGPCTSFDFALNAQCVGATTETVSVYFGGAPVGSFDCIATANTNFPIRLRGTMTWVSATSVLVDFWADIKNGLAGTYTVFNTSASLTLTLANPQTFEIRGQGSVAGNGLERLAGKVQAG